MSKEWNTGTAVMRDIEKMRKIILNDTGQQEVGLVCNLETFKKMGIDAKKYGEHLGRDVYRVKDQRA